MHVFEGKRKLPVPETVLLLLLLLLLLLPLLLSEELGFPEI
jgi:hypothetical protein